MRQNAVTVMGDAKAPAERPVPKVATVQGLLEKMQDQFKKALPQHITPERMIRVAMTCIRNNKQLLECEQISLISSVMTCAQLGLEPDPILGQVYLVPFNCKEKDASGRDVWIKKCQAIVGYRGLITLARNSGEVQSIVAKEVYSKDDFEIDWGQEVPFRHKPYLGQDRGDIIFVWCLVRFKDGSIHWDYMTIGEVQKIRDKSQGYSQALKYAKRDEKGNLTSVNSPWFTDFAEMAKKTVIRRVAKYLPLSVQKAAFIEDMADKGKLVKFDDDDGGFSVVGEYDPDTGEVYDQSPDPAPQIEHQPQPQANYAEQSAPEPVSAPAPQQSAPAQAPAPAAPAPRPAPAPAPAKAPPAPTLADDDELFS